MNKIYLVGHPAGRFQDDLLAIRLKAEYCPDCDGRIDSRCPPLEFYWDKEFQNKKALQLKNRKVYWGAFLMLVPEDIRNGLAKLNSFDFHDTYLVKTKHTRREVIVERLGKTDPVLYWARPKFNVVARVSGSTPNPTCNTCGLFTGHPRQLTRLIVSQSEAPKSGIFYIKQNGDPQIFVTAEAKQRFESLGIDAGYYPAGRIE